MFAADRHRLLVGLDADRNRDGNFAVNSRADRVRAGAVSSPWAEMSVRSAVQSSSGDAQSASPSAMPAQSHDG